MRLARVYVVHIVILTWSSIAQAQMSYSVYTDMWGNDPNVVGYAELDDGSGCLSGITAQSTTLYSPTRMASSGGSTTQMAYSSETGDWTVVGNYTMQCNCSPYGGGHVFGFGSGLTWHLSHKVTYYTNGSYYPPFCYYPTTACTSGTPSCTSGTGFNITGGCPTYLEAHWAVATRGTTYVCLISVSWFTGGASRPCS